MWNELKADLKDLAFSAFVALTAIMIIGFTYNAYLTELQDYARELSSYF